MKLEDLDKDLLPLHYLRPEEALAVVVPGMATNQVGNRDVVGQRSPHIVEPFVAPDIGSVARIEGRY